MRGYAEKYRRYRVRRDSPPWNRTRASASDGRIGRRCTVPPSATTTSASQWAGGSTSGRSAGCSVTRIVGVEAEQREDSLPGGADRAVEPAVTTGHPRLHVRG